MTETWKPVLGYEGLYEVSDMGNVRTVSGRPVRQRTVRKGYSMVSIRRDKKNKDRRVHVLVLEAFVAPRPTGFEARHLNGNPADNRLVNLAWGTQAENNQDRWKHGTIVNGARHPFAKFTDDEVIEILRSPESGRSLAKRLGVAPSTVHNIRCGATWRRVTGITSEAA